MNKKIFIGIAIFWVVIFAVFIGSKEFTLQTGQEVLLKTEPVDPRDLFRGDYVTLGFEISRVELGDKHDFEPGDTIYLALQNTEGYGTYDSASHSLQETELPQIKGEVESVLKDSVRIHYGIESYFVPENVGKAIEILQGEDVVDVLISIDKFGNSIIKDLLIEGEPVDFDKLRDEDE
jgi:uncharacterized membrane-anchored protein